VDAAAAEGAGAVTWSPQQQAMLAAMGYTLYRLAGQEPAAADLPAKAVAIRPTAAATEPLLQALQRAAGGRDLAALALSLPDLRASAAAKRALWPRLRALRRS
jgi:hypothetical protein